MDSAGKEKESKMSKPVHRPPLQARVAAANRTVLATLNDDPGAHGHEQGAKQHERGKNDEGSGHGMAKASRQTKPAEQGRCRQTQPADDPTCTGLEAKQLLQTIRPIQASQQNNSHRCWLASRRAVQVGGGSAVVPATQKAGSDLPYLPVSLPPIAFACHRPYPLP